jgi:hypothetical protein
MRLNSLMDIEMPPAFPGTDFRAFLLAASNFFPALMSDEALFDPQEKRRHFEWSWQAVRYRYRSCAQCQDEFKALLANASEAWRAGWGDEELNYKLERCVYMFFMSGVSVFDSFAFSLYFLGHAIQPGAFPEVANPRHITWRVTAKAYSAAFPHAKLTRLLAALPDDTGFSTIDAVRNLVGHRISGRRSIAASSTTHADATRTEWREETWALPGAAEKLTFDEELLQRHLDDITRLLTALTSATREFVQNISSRDAQLE